MVRLVCCTHSISCTDARVVSGPVGKPRLNVAAGRSQLHVYLQRRVDAEGQERVIGIVEEVHRREAPARHGTARRDTQIKVRPGLSSKKKGA